MCISHRCARDCLPRHTKPILEKYILFFLLYTYTHAECVLACASLRVHFKCTRSNLCESWDIFFVPCAILCVYLKTSSSLGALTLTATKYIYKHFYDYFDILLVLFNFFFFIIFNFYTPYSCFRMFFVSRIHFHFITITMIATMNTTNSK